jgi:predicted CXXCH cytochrome family protein
MPRVELSLLLVPFVVALAAPAAAATADDPHLDPALLPGGCPSCHVGHGKPGSPMLPAAQREVCLSCHGTLADRDLQVSVGGLTLEADPGLIGDSLDQQSTHPMTSDAFDSDEQRSVVTCSSCHNPHRSVPRVGLVGDAPVGLKKRTSVRGRTFEYETCIACHGASRLRRDPNVNRRENVAALTESTSRSFHPIQVPPQREVPSTLPELTSTEINCTDCHGNGDVQDGRGPHGSPYPYVLVARYETRDGQTESAETYALCYRCHDREAVLNSPDFPEHALHVTEVSASCASCHNPHGAMENRALIRFGETPLPPGIAPSIETGILAFSSSGPGSGACYVNCHGYEHAPAVYGAGGEIDALLGFDDEMPGRTLRRDSRPRFPVPSPDERPRRDD